MLPLPSCLPPDSEVTVRETIQSPQISFLIFSASVVVAYSQEGQIIECFTSDGEYSFNDVVLCRGTYAALSASRSLPRLIMWESHAEDEEHFADTSYPLSRVSRSLPLPSPPLAFLLPPHASVPSSPFPFLLYKDGSLARIHAAGVSAPSSLFKPSSSPSSQSYSPVFGAAYSSTAAVLYRDNTRDGVYTLSWAEHTPSAGIHTRLPPATVLLSPPTSLSNAATSSETDEYRRNVDHDPVCMWMMAGNNINKRHQLKKDKRGNEDQLTAVVLWDTGYITRIHLSNTININIKSKNNNNNNNNRNENRTIDTDPDAINTSVLSFPSHTLSFKFSSVANTSSSLPINNNTNARHNNAAMAGAVLLRDQQYVCVVGPAASHAAVGTENTVGTHTKPNINNNNNNNNDDTVMIAACCWDTTYHTLQSTTEVWEYDPSDAASSLLSVSAASVSSGKMVVVTAGTARSCRIITPDLPNVSTALLLSSSNYSSDTSSAAIYPHDKDLALPSWLHSGVDLDPLLQRMADRDATRTENDVQRLFQQLQHDNSRGTWSRHPVATAVVARVLADNMWETLSMMLSRAASVPVRDHDVLVSGIIQHQLISVFHQAVGERRVTGIPEEQLVRLIMFLSNDNNVPLIASYIHKINDSRIRMMPDDHPTEAFLTFILNYPHGPALFSALRALNKNQVEALFKYINKWIHRLHFQDSQPFHNECTPCPSHDALVSWASALCAAQLPTIATHPDLAQHASTLKQLVSDVEHKEREAAAVMGVMRSLVKRGITTSKTPSSSKMPHNITKFTFDNK